MNKVEVIYFDLWNTLATKNSGVLKTIQKQFKTIIGDNLFKYEHSVQTQKWNSINDLSKKFIKDFGVPFSSTNEKFITDTFLKVNQKAALFSGTQKILEDLSKNYRLAIISNTTNFEGEVLKKMKIETFFEKTFFSWQTGYLKPQTEAYTHPLKIMGVPPEKSLFIDDSKDNVTASIEVGMKGLVYINNDKLKKDLKDLGIIGI